MTIDVDRLPFITLSAGTILHRIHRAANGPWYFSGDGTGRFDPIVPPNRGSCYFADDPLGAWVESFRTNTTLLDRDVHARVLSTVELGEAIEVADLTDRRALLAGVTVAVSGGLSYGDSQQIASELQGRCAGIRWRVRHDLAQVLIGIALFGPRGPQPDDYMAVSTKPISGDLIRAAEDAFGYRVIPLIGR